MYRKLSIHTYSKFVTFLSIKRFCHATALIETLTDLNGMDEKKQNSEKPA